MQIKNTKFNKFCLIVMILCIKHEYIFDDFFVYILSNLEPIYKYIG